MQIHCNEFFDAKYVKKYVNYAEVLKARHLHDNLKV